MSKLTLNVTMSLDGYVAGPDQSESHPLGAGGEDHVVEAPGVTHIRYAVAQ
jgi:hypothetical protein